MSYDIRLSDPITKETIEFDQKHHMIGGTYCVGGTTEAWINITYNYAKYYYQHIDEGEGIRFLYGKTGAETIPILEDTIEKLGNDVSDDYWEATEGNAKRALYQLLSIAKMRPDGIWDGD